MFFPASCAYALIGELSSTAMDHTDVVISAEIG